MLGQVENAAGGVGGDLAPAPALPGTLNDVMLAIIAEPKTPLAALYKKLIRIVISLFPPTHAC